MVVSEPNSDPRVSCCMPSVVTPTAPFPVPRCWNSYHRHIMRTLFPFIVRCLDDAVDLSDLCDCALLLFLMPTAEALVAC